MSEFALARWFMSLLAGEAEGTDCVFVRTPRAEERRVVVDDARHAQDVHGVGARHRVDDGVLHGDAVADEALVAFDAPEPLARDASLPFG